MMGFKDNVVLRSIRTPSLCSVKRKRWHISEIGIFGDKPKPDGGLVFRNANGVWTCFLDGDFSTRSIFLAHPDGPGCDLVDLKFTAAPFGMTPEVRHIIKGSL
jgi:hypothetical protein